MLKATIGIILFICVNIDIIRTTSRDNVVNTKFVRQKSPTYDPNKKGDVIFYMPEHKDEIHRANNKSANINLKNNPPRNINIGYNTAPGVNHGFGQFSGKSSNMNNGINTYKNQPKHFQSMNYQKNGPFGNKLEQMNIPANLYNNKNNSYYSGSNNGNNNSYGLHDNKISPIGNNGRPGHLISHFNNPNQKLEFLHGFDGLFNQNIPGMNHKGNYGFNGVNIKGQGKNEKFDNYGQNLGLNKTNEYQQMINGNNMGSDHIYESPNFVNGNNMGSDNAGEYQRLVNGNNMGSDHIYESPNFVNGNNMGSDNAGESQRLVNGNNMGSDNAGESPKLVNGNNMGSDNAGESPKLVNGNNMGSDNAGESQRLVNGNNMGSDNAGESPKLVNGNNMGSDNAGESQRLVNGNNMGSDNSGEYQRLVNGNNMGSDNSGEYQRLVNGNNMGSDHIYESPNFVNGNNMGSDNAGEYQRLINGNNMGSDNAGEYQRLINGNNMGSDHIYESPNFVNGNNMGSDNAGEYQRLINGNNMGSDNAGEYQRLINGNNMGSDHIYESPNFVNGNNMGSDNAGEYQRLVNGNNMGSDNAGEYQRLVNGNNMGSDHIYESPNLVNGNNMGSDNSGEYQRLVNGNNMGSDNAGEYQRLVNGNNMGSDHIYESPNLVNGNNMGSDNSGEYQRLVNGNNMGSDDSGEYQKLVNGNNGVIPNFTGNDQEIFKNIRGLRPVNHEELYKNKMNPLIYNAHGMQSGNKNGAPNSTSDYVSDYNSDSDTDSDSDSDSDLDYDSESNESNVYKIKTNKLENDNKDGNGNVNDANYYKNQIDIANKNHGNRYNSENDYGDSMHSDSALSYERDLSSGNRHVKEGSNDEINIFYRDNAQDRETKEKLMNSSESDKDVENPLNITIPEENVNYHFSNYMNFDKKNILTSNEEELLKMIGPDFSKEVSNYCSKKSIFPSNGKYLDVSFEYSKELGKLREKMMSGLFKKKGKLVTKENNILKQIENSLKMDYLERQQGYVNYGSKSNELKNDEESMLSNEYNKLLEEYICHILSNNPGKTQFEKLYYHNLALGEIMKPIKTKYKNAATLSIALNYEIYIVSSSNIYLFGHMLLLSLAYLSYNSYFTKGTKSFYSMETMLLANSDYSFFMYNEMCNVYYRPNKSFKKDLTFIPIELRPGRYTTYVGERKIICNTLELILNAISLININEIYNVFHKNNVYGYENSVSFSNNAIRVFSQVCPRNMEKNIINCSFEKSTLYKANAPEDTNQNEYQRQNQIKNQNELKKAFDLLNTFSEIESFSNNNYQNSYYIKLIMEQNLYTDFYKYLFWYDNRELIKTHEINGKKNTKKTSNYIYDQYIKTNRLLEKKFNVLSKHNLKSKGLLAFHSLIDRYSEFVKNKKIRNLYLKFVSYARHFLFMNNTMKSLNKSDLDFMKMIFEELQNETKVPLKLIVRGNYMKSMNDIAKKENLFFINLFILSLFSNKNPVKNFYNGKREMLKASLSEKFATSTSAFIPHKLRRIVVGMKKGFLKRKLLKTLMKNRLLQHIPIDLLENIMTTFRFTTHAIATSELAQNAHRTSKYLNSNNTSKLEFAKTIFSKGGFPQYADKLMEKWFSKGFEEYKKEKIDNQNMENEVDKELDQIKEMFIPGSNGKHNSNTPPHLIENINTDVNNSLDNQDKYDNTLGKQRVDKLIYNEHDKWDHYINKEYVKALGAWIEIHKKSNNVMENILQAVEDSKYLLENNIEDSIFFSRTFKATKQSAFRNVLNKTLSLGKMLLRKPSFKVDHALWFGATINMKKGFALLEKVSELHKLIRHEDESWLINEAFIEIVDHIIAISTPSSISSRAGYLSNPGMFHINPFYHRLSNEERLKELQQYMCYDHCSSLWKMLSTFALHHLKNPDSLQTYEDKFSKNSLGNKMTDKDFVNNFKMILGGDAALHFYDNLLPKSMKKELKSMKYGVSLSFSFSLKLAKMVFGEMQLPHLSHMFYAQAPYFGHFIGKWQKERQQGRLKEILGAMTLGTLSTYTVLSAMDITQHATDIGMGPSTSCYTSLLPPPKSICIQQTVKTVLTNSTLASMKSVFSVGLFAAITPYMFAPMAGLAVWSVLKSQFKVVNRIDMALKGALKNMWNKFMSLKGIRRLKNVFKKIKTIKKKMIQKTEKNLAEIQQNPEAEQNHKAAVNEIHNNTRGNYHYISYAKIVV
ncbi:rhoptry neck protein 2 [Plasmodium yoelii yoelii]|uniref:Rhoptry neck protein 2 n=1 Tax=Plasmodium yoelii yoelii TaxID=73239 RepID=A0AAF0B6I9_PLAYO|nr:rhoptry neck protein 2 [Plasmodium yoelii yoelii]